MKIQKIVFIVGLAIALSSFNLSAQGILDAESIVKNTNERDDGEYLSQELTFELIGRRGKKRVNITTSFRKYYGKEKRLAIFYQSPSNIKGTAFLTYDYPESGKDDDQWLYLPALRKTRRISASDKGDYFLGTDLTYEDIKLAGKLSEYDYHYKVLGIETVNGHECYVIEGVPKTEKLKKELGYNRVKSWIDTKIWMIRKGEFWDVGGNHLKSLEVKDIEKISGIWTAKTFFVKNHKTGHQTFLRFSNIDYKTVVDDDIFTEESLVNGI